jgi:hypothetical protein
MSHYARLSEKRKLFHALTGSTLEEFQALLPAFRASFLTHMERYTLAGKERGRVVTWIIAIVHCGRSKIN